MRIPAFRKVRTKDQDLNGVQDQAAALSKALSNIQILDGNGFEDIELVSGTAKNIEHLLDRSYVGYFITKKSANAVVWDSVSTTPHRTLVLNASANCTVSLWVF